MIFIQGLTRILFHSTAIAVITVSSAVAAMDPRFELDPTSLDGAVTASKAASPKQPRPARRPARNIQEGSRSKGTHYIVKPGDHLFKILMRDYGLTNNEADNFIDEIRRENNILDIRRLKIGQKIVIPPVRRKTDGTLDVIQITGSAPGISSDERQRPSGQTFRIEPTTHSDEAPDSVSQLKEAWNKMVPAKQELLKPLKLESERFSLSLDPSRYPVFATMDGGRILLDLKGAIPPLLKTLIEEKDPTITIVTETSGTPRQILGTMLKAGRFYSVEEQYSMEFGVDPKLTVRSDYKVERTPESLIKNDVLLLNAGTYVTPGVMGDFLKKEGFTLHEPFATLKSTGSGTHNQIVQITATDQMDITDAVLRALSITTDRDRQVDLFTADNNGISLSVKAERSFMHSGQRYVVTRFDGDPVTYTLFRILETMGYRVVILDQRDDFRKVSEKIASRLRLAGSFAMHRLWPEGESNYSLQMSGFKFEGPASSGGTLFITNRELDRIIKDLANEHGYAIQTP